MLQFIQSDPRRRLVAAYRETGVSRTAKCETPELKQALQACLETQSILLVVNFKKLLTHAPSLTLISMFLRHRDPRAPFEPDIRCCDMPIVTRENFDSIIHLEVQKRKVHREKILTGLSSPTAKKSGNPNAAKLISSVNWPKINNAILFAIHLQPIIDQFEQKGFSQRRILNCLNSSNITAPEGGKWVLSQLQKVIERIKLNQITIQLHDKISAYENEYFSSDEMAQALNSAGIRPIKGTLWTSALVYKMRERKQQLNDILALTEFLKKAKPIFIAHATGNLSPSDLLPALERASIDLPERLLELIS